MLAAKSDLPEPALPFNTVTVLLRIFCNKVALARRS
jgi:hypothetical protein